MSDDNARETKTLRDQLFGSIKKNMTEEIRIAIRNYKGREFVDIRLFFQNDQGEMIPTKKGVSFSPELIPEFKAIAEKLN